MTAEEIRALNDGFGTTMTGGRVLMTAGVDALPSDVKAIVIRRVAAFSDFNGDNDPHSEHDFGSFDLAGPSSLSNWITTMRRWSSARKIRPIRRRRRAY